MIQSIGAGPAKLSIEDIEQAFDAKTKRVWKSPLYLVGLSIVALAMVLLPLIYLSLIALAGYGVYYHATEHTALLLHGAGYRGRLVLAVVYVAPIVAGAVLIFFMLKPLLARAGERQRRISLVRKNEPVLFALVDKLCKIAGAPVPKRIDVNCDVNASASFRRGWLSLFWPGDLVLTVGLPLVAGMDLRQFSGVLAHEFGHFAQGLGMRLWYLIIAINGWFSRVVYERDAWDERLLVARGNDDWRIALMARFTAALVWLTRKILWLLMVVGHGISCAMSRQMEYDADRHQVRVCGSQGFESTFQRLNLLSVASAGAYAAARTSWRDGRLSDNFPALFVSKVEEIPPEIRARMVADMETRKTQMFSTHPSATARIRRARQANEPGAFRGDGPASAVFSDFRGLCKSASLFHYQDLLGAQVTPANLIPSEVFDNRIKEAREAQQAAGRFFRGCLTTVRPLPVDPFAKTSRLAPKDCLEKLKRARQALSVNHDVIHRAYTTFTEAEAFLTVAQTLQSFVKMGVTIEPRDVGLSFASAAEVWAERDRTRERQRQAAEHLAKIEPVLRMRLECALALLDAKQVAARVENADRLHQRAEELVHVVARVHSVCGTLAEMQKDQLAVKWVAHFAGAENTPEAVYRLGSRLIESQHGRLRDLGVTLGDDPYPFKHAAGSVTLSSYAVKVMPSKDDAMAVLHTCEAARDNLDSLYSRAMGELARIAETVEAAVGLKPLNPPAPKEEGGKSEAA